MSGRQTVSKEAEMTTPHHEHRLRMAKQANEKVSIIKTYYKWNLTPNYDPKKGRKLMMVQKTVTGSTSLFVGWEKKIPEIFFQNLLKDGHAKTSKKGTIELITDEE